MLVEYIENHLRELDEIIEDENNFVKIDKRKVDGNAICEKEVKKIAADICRVEVRQIESGYRKQEVVCARWLVLMYLDRFSSYNRNQQAAIVMKDHATATNAIQNVDEFTGWRKINKIKFENRINAIHEAVGINKYF
jgi:chromosomal replication initiation ATPase DnaA